MADDIEPTRVLPHVFLGSKAHARDRALLQRLGITHILNVTPPKSMDPVAGVPNFFEKDKTLTYRRCPIFDNKAEDISGVLEGCVAFMDQAKYYGHILVHCSKGVSRSTSMVVAYLMKIEGMALDAALALVTSKRPIANPNASFRRQLEDFGEKLRRAAASAEAKKTRAAGVRGPQGPARAPAPRAAAIGPQLPPHLQKAPARAPAADDDARSAASPTGAKDSDACERAVVIGPSRPPPASRKRERDAPSSSDATADSVGHGSDSAKRPCA